MPEMHHLLPELDPPAGGLARLRHRIADTGARRERHRRALRWSLATAVPLLILVALLPAPIQRWQHRRALTRALQATMPPVMPADGLRVKNGAALPLPSGQANVRLYLVQSIPPAQNTPAAD